MNNIELLQEEALSLLDSFPNGNTNLVADFKKRIMRATSEIQLRSIIKEIAMYLKILKED